MFQPTLLKKWTDEQIEQMRGAIFVAEHRLAELPLFKDDELIRILDQHPRKDLGVNTMGSDPARRSDWQEGDAGDLDGKSLLEITKRGRLWLNVRRVMDHHPEFHNIVNTLYDELETLCGEGMFNRSANLLISSPTAMVYYHLDCPANMLWHIRGEKRVWAYPLESGIVSPETIEAVLTGEASEELAFRPEYDAKAKVVDLKPGQMITWPQHTPHRVVNTSGLNVSLSTEHMTQRALRKNNVYLANRHFRRMLGRGFTSTRIEGPAAALKEAAIRIVRRLPVVGPKPPQGFKYPVTFQVNPRVPTGVRPLDVSRPAVTPVGVPGVDLPTVEVSVLS
jgi:hypothetical protein